MKNWQLQVAKARLSEVVKSATTEGPQTITVRGRPAAVLLSQKDFERLSRRGGSFWEFMRKSPWVGVDLRLERDRSLTRRTAL
jgi:antitoxin Phd